MAKTRATPNRATGMVAPLFWSQSVGSGLGGASEAFVPRPADCRRLVLPLAFADLPLLDGLGPGEAADDLGAVASWIDCRSWSNFLSTSALARATVVWVALMASASRLQP